MEARATQGPVAGDFAGRPGDFFGLALRGSLLQIPTFGFYRFWLLTDVRRHLWANTRIGGESFEYTGLGKELLIGFLIALAILAPIYFIYFLIGLEAERLQAFASVPLFLFIYFFAQYGAFRARRYRATRTIFRGLRFWMTGSGWAYAVRALLWDALSVLTLGLAFPWRAAALERYRMKHTHFGDVPGAFVGTGWTFFKRGFWLWLLAVVLVFGTSALPVVLGAWAAGLSVLAVLFVLLVGWPMFRAIQLRWRLEGMRFGELSVASELAKRRVFGCYVKAWLAGLLFAMIVGGVVGSAILPWLPNLENLATRPGGGVPSVPVIAGLVLLYLFVLVGFGVIKLQFIDRGIWAAAVNSVTVTNLHALDGAVARGAPAGSIGEGLTDALDIGGGGV